ncbi:type II toxin-antitoxin system VapC family toxin [Limnofasciculus baicalensis]|uniref:Ribonuclease VapC n=1 Tax=Limnofasciculus baicalensis BBK-W-15 TaxID=2699891 RepID=A0AAE3GNV8_9CYAN|nr:type II toxin-antitoxin system VapC family toxin [Limnofasciculus baicalensis]MCP2727083.1 type II toxin-antitoxin system VapC family toxin [Limnofasciculus baicalensis BBK-W-15]
MTYQYLLDTNIISDLVKQPQGLVFQRIATVGEDRICTSIIVACELRFGAAKSRSSRLFQQLECILDVLPILSLETPVDLHYAEIRTHLEQAGTPVSPNDLLIAAHALALNLTLVTANVREFERIPALNVENWLLPK